MAEIDQAVSAEDDASPVDYAFWEVPGEASRIIYSLQLFHEIDFVVNEGYRKIPHGGIETAGLLFGSASANEIRIEAFRPIECEHVSGPSLNFSENDLSALETQIQEAGKDRRLLNYVPIGWFLGHTRGPLELSETEAKQFDRFFPEPARVTVLVKPERFQPTRFGFLARRANGEMPREALKSAVILPLPGRSFKPGQLVPSIPAPSPIAVKRPTPADPPPVSELVVAPAETEAENRPPRRSRPKPPPPEPALESIWKVPPADAGEETPLPVQSEERRKLARERARLIEEAYPSPQQAAAPPVPAPTELAPFRPPPLAAFPRDPVLPRDMLRYIPSAYDRYTGAVPKYADEPAARSILNARSLTALALSALLGCLVGYIAYLQLPAPVIPIDVRPVEQTIVVSWPPEETRNAVYAAIRLNDGAPMPLSAQERKTGHVSVTALRDFKVEIVAKNWIRDSRGIVRYMHSNNGNGLAMPLDLPPSH